MTEITVHDIPGCNASALIATSGEIVFREERDTTPVPLGDTLSYMPWGSGNAMPYRILSRFEEDETLSACEAFISEVCYASGLRYELCEGGSPLVMSEIDRFFLENDMDGYFLGVCRDMKMFEFAVSVLSVSADGLRIEGVHRKEAAYCRFAPAQADGSIPYVLYGNWRLPVCSPEQVEQIPLVDSRRPWASLNTLIRSGHRKVGIVSRVPGADSMYYPIPSYGSLFRGKWYDIKRHIGVAKEAKLRNSAPIKYLIEVSQRYWDNLFRSNGLTDPASKAQARARAKQEMVDFLTGARNSGKALFSDYYVSPEGKEVHDIKITKIEDDKEGGDWASDHAEAVNMICFAMRVHSNLVGSVPGKSQSNNSGSDKRELYTIAQALQKPYRDCLFPVHRLIIAYNGWAGARPVVPMLQLTTLDEHRDAKETTAP